MSEQIIERANMPVISSNARKSLNRSIDFETKAQTIALVNATNQPQESVIETCLTCGQEYNKASASKFLQSITLVENFDYQDKCLNCISKASNEKKEASLPAIKELKDAFNEITQELKRITFLHQITKAQWEEKLAEYSSLDYQEKRIINHLKPVIVETKVTEKKAQRTNKQLQRDLVMKLLNKLTKEQKEAMLKHVAKQ